MWTVRELAEHVAIGGRGPLFVGSPEQIADTLTEWVEATDIDGFNLAYAVTPESFEDFVDLVVPELTRRGVYKREYRARHVARKAVRRPAAPASPHPTRRRSTGSRKKEENTLPQRTQRFRRERGGQRARSAQSSTPGSTALSREILGAARQ